MHIVVTGATGTGKGAIVELLHRRGFQLIEMPEIDLNLGYFDRQRKFLVNRIATHLKAQALAGVKDVVTVRSPYDTHLIYKSTLKEVVSPSEQAMLDELMTAFEDVIVPPASVIYTHCSPINALNRIALTSKSVPQEEFNLELQAFNVFADKIKTPMVQVNFDDNMEQIRQDFEFNFASLKSTNVVAQSIWQKSFWKPGTKEPQ